MNRKIWLAIPTAIIAYVGVQAVADQAATDRVDEVITSLGDDVDVSYGEASIGLAGMNLHLRDVVVRDKTENQEAIQIGELILYDIDEENDIPNWLKIELRNVSGVAGEFFAEAGFGPDVTPSFELQYRYDAEERRLQIESVAANLEGAGRLSFSMDLGNIDLAQSTIENPMMLLPVLQLNSLRLQFEDDSLIERLIESKAKRDSTSAEAVRDGWLMQVDGALASSNDELSLEVLGSIRSFIEDPDEIALSISPKNPVPIINLANMQPAQIIAALNIHIE